MSGEEKAAQVGEAVQAYQTAKVECAHIEQKIKQVFRAFADAGETMDERRGTTSEPRFVNDKLEIGFRGGDIAKTLMNEQELIALIRERDKVREKLAHAKKVMNDLGITSVS